MVVMHISFFKILTTLFILYAFLRTYEAEKALNVNGSVTEPEFDESSTGDLEISPDRMPVEKQWELLESKAKSVATSFVKALMPVLMANSNTMNISRTCMRDTMILLKGLRDIKYWALRFLDSSGKMLDGVLNGRLSALGDYDECIKTMVYDKKTKKDKKKLLLRGKYCIVDFKPPLPRKKHFVPWTEVADELKNFSKRETVFGELARYALFFHTWSLRFGICVPSGCSTNDIQQVSALVSRMMPLKGQAVRCEIKRDVEFTSLQIIIIISYSFLGFLVFIGSIIDLHSYYTKRNYTNKGVQLLLAFSFPSNFKKLINMKTSKDDITCLNGIRFLSMSWIIVGHTYFINNNQMFSFGTGDLQDAFREIGGNFAFQTMLNAVPAVDTFLFISGLLVCYTVVTSVKIQKKNFSFASSLFNRLWRLYPLYIFVLSFAFWWHLLGSGPMWHDLVNFDQGCYVNWWTNFLFINNWYNTDNMCLIHTWYMATDMQLRVVALLILMLLLRKPKLGIFITVFCILASVAVCGTITFLYNYPPAVLMLHIDPEQREAFLRNTYYKPFPHIGPYFIGFLVGYILATRPSFKIPKSIQVIGWCCAVSCGMSVVYGVHRWNMGHEPTKTESILYSSCKGIAWGLSLAWMVLCCETKCGGIINNILSWKIWIPLGRLSFAAYLVHPFLIIAVMGSFRNTGIYTYVFSVWLFFGHLCASYGLSFACNVLVESPFQNLQKMIFCKNTAKQNDNHTSCGNDYANSEQTKKVENTIVLSISMNNWKEEISDSEDKSQVSRTQ